jgi:hypothetical protein
MQLIVSSLIIITIALTAIPGNQGLVIAQQLDGSDVVNTTDSLNNNVSQIPTGSVPNENQTQSFFNTDNQSVMLPEPIRDNIDRNIAESAGPQGPGGEVGPQGPGGEVGPQGPAGNNSIILKENMYVNNGVQQSTSEEESFVTTFAACNDNDIPLSGGYSIVGAEEEDNNGEINEIESIPNIQNSSWTINVEGEDIQITPYVVCLNTTTNN